MIELSEILDAARERGVKYLVHYTQFQNLKSIFNYGLLNHASLEERGIKYAVSDEDRKDKYSKSICMSISFPNYKILYNKYNANGNSHWALLFLEPAQILGVKECFFYTGNAAHHKRRFDKHPYTIDDFERMFDPIGNHIRSSIPDSFSTDPQAEIQCVSSIPVEAIRRVVLLDQSDFNIVWRWHLAWENSDNPLRFIDIKSEQWIENNKSPEWIERNYGFREYPFGPRRDYEEWK